MKFPENRIDKMKGEIACSDILQGTVISKSAGRNNIFFFPKAGSELGAIFSHQIVYPLLFLVVFIYPLEIITEYVPVFSGIELN